MIRKVRRSPGTMTVGALLAGSLDERWHTFLRLLRSNKRRCTEPSIHDLRVSLRRLNATLDMVRAVAPDDRLSAVRRTLRKHLKSFNELRDVHVQLLMLRYLARRYPVLRPYTRRLRVEERRLVTAARKRIRTIKVTPVGSVLAAQEGRLLGLMTTAKMNEVGTAVAVGAMGSAFAKAIERLAEVNPGDYRTVHRLRVAFKQCRYTVESLQPLLDGVGRRQLKAMNAYQTRMGDIQDIEVLIAGVNAFALQSSRHAPGSFVAVQQELARRRKLLVDEFLKRTDELYGFWKPLRGTGPTDVSA